MPKILLSLLLVYVVETGSTLDSVSVHSSLKREANPAASGNDKSRVTTQIASCSRTVREGLRSSDATDEQKLLEGKGLETPKKNRASVLEPKQHNPSTRPRELATRKVKIGDGMSTTIPCTKRALSDRVNWRLNSRRYPPEEIEMTHLSGEVGPEISGGWRDEFGSVAVGDAVQFIAAGGPDGQDVNVLVFQMFIKHRDEPGHYRLFIDVATMNGKVIGHIATNN